jgi:probable HAF family extracellular repeat protein
VFEGGAMSAIALNGSSSVATAINNAGKIVGYSVTTGKDAQGNDFQVTEGFSYLNGDVDTFTNGTVNRFNAVANQNPYSAGSAAGTTNGSVEVPGGAGYPATPFGGRPDVPFYQAEYHADLPVTGPAPSGATAGNAWGVNDIRDIVGDVLINGRSQAAYWDWNNQDGYHTMLLPGLASNVESEAWDINNKGQIVGSSGSWTTYSNGSAVTDGYGFLYDGGATTNINDLIDPGLGWNLAAAYAINEHGQITGMGIIGGQAHAFLMTPLSYTPPPAPEPVTWMTMVCGFGFVGATMRRRKRHPAVNRSLDCRSAIRS